MAWLETYLKKFKGTLVVVTHDRYFLNNVTEWILELDGGHALSLQGQLRGWLEQKQALLEAREQAGGVAPQAAGAGAAVGPAEPVGPAGQEQGAPEALRGTRQPAGGHARGHARNPDPARRRGSAISSCARENLTKAFGDRLLMENVNFDLPRGGIVGVIGAQRRGQDHAVPDDHRPGEADIRHADRRASGCRCRYVDQIRDALDPDNDGLRGDHRRRGIAGPRRPADEQPRLLRAVQLQGRGPAEAGRQALRRRAQPRASRQAAAQRRQPAAARRADQRPRREHAARAGGRPDELRRLRRGRSATTAGSWTASPRTSSPSRATAR